jgi:glutamine amidotransferase
MITIVNYGMGNIGSLLNMFKRIGVKANIESEPEQLLRANKIVLPGVGAFDSAMQRINQKPGLLEVLHQKANIEQIPILGICLGMQLLTNSSEEGELAGLGWINGSVKRFPSDINIKVPHMGWNIAIPAKQSKLTTGLDEQPRYYFVHSYYVNVLEKSHALMKTNYGLEFDSAIEKDNIMGVQFHPEKSHKFGMKILENFSLT